MDRIGYPGLEEAQNGERAIGFYFLKHEIIPHNAHGIHHFEGKEGKPVEEFQVRSCCRIAMRSRSSPLLYRQDPLFNCRAVLESQFLSFRLRVSGMLSSSTGLPQCVASSCLPVLSSLVPLDQHH